MPSYDYRCNQCGRSFALFFKSIKDYDPSAQQICPHCQSVEVVRRIRRVAIQKPGRDFSSLDSNEMLNVFNSGDSRQVGKLFEQVAATTGEDLGGDYREATERLLKGESMESVERDLSNQDSTGGGDAD
jgi:putative FmdB family regulatory protein